MAVVYITQALEEEVRLSLGDIITCFLDLGDNVIQLQFLVSKPTVARSEDKLTLAWSTPSSLFRLRSMVATQFAQVIPVMGRMIVFFSGI
jgi:hypothetical protein